MPISWTAGGDVGENAVDADGYEDENYTAEDGHQQEGEARACVYAGADELFERGAVGQGDSGVQAGYRAARNLAGRGGPALCGPGCRGLPWR